MNRRTFLSAAVAAPVALRAARAAAGAKITRITCAPTEGRFHRFVAMNAYDLAPKGHTYPTTVLRIQTDQGIEGVGVMGYAPPDAAFLDALKTLIGADPLNLYRMDAGRIVGRNPQYETVLKSYRLLDGPLFDLVGKLTGKAVWQLLGTSARDRVDAYDTTLYFSDVWFKDRGVRAIVEETEEAQRFGYSAVKVKLGRGSKWMEKSAGLQRDIEVVHAVRKVLGTQARIMVDPNNGYKGDREGAWRLLAETEGDKLYWMEEIFPETVDDYTWLREKMAKAGMKTLIADGESVDQPAKFEPYLKPKRLMDVLQPDIRRCGFLDTLAVSRLGEPVGATCMPHNWGSQVGMLMTLQMSKAVKNIPGMEDDRSTCDVFIAEGYDFHKGAYTVPDKPGLAIRIDESVYRLKCKPKETVVG